MDVSDTLDEAEKLEGTNYYWTGSKVDLMYWPTVAESQLLTGRQKHDQQLYKYSIPTVTSPGAENADGTSLKEDTAFICIRDSQLGGCFLEPAAFRKRIRGGYLTNYDTWKDCYLQLKADHQLAKDADNDQRSNLPPGTQSRKFHPARVYDNEGKEISDAKYNLFYSNYFKKLLDLGSLEFGEIMNLDKVNILERFTTIWKSRAKGAYDFSKEWTKAVSDRIFDFRFYSVPSDQRTIELGVWTEVDFLNEKIGDITVLQSICDAIEFTKGVEEGKKTPPAQTQCKFVHLVQNSFDKAEYVVVANHPLGFYILLMKKPALKSLILSQCAGEYYRDVPSPGDVHAFNDQLKRKEAMLSTRSSGRQSISTTEIVARDPRMNTKSIMGQSANAWAKSTLGWKTALNKDTDVVAEWLHLIAHGTGGGITDSFDNLVFGTRECNTYMLRIETASRALAALDEVRNASGKMGIQYEIERKDTFKMLSKNLTEDQKEMTEDLTEFDFMTKRSWLVGQILYGTNLSVQQTRIQLINYAGVMKFQPFHRFVPFRYEISLDARVKEAFAKHLGKTIPGCAPVPGLLSGPFGDLRRSSRNKNRQRAF